MGEQKKVLILTADIGFGHRSAANAVASALQETYGERCKVEIVNPLEDERTPGILRDSAADYDRLVREMPEIYRLRYQISDTPVPNAIVESVVTVMLFRIIDDLVLRHQPDVIISTHPMFPAPLAAVIALSKTNIPCMTVVTDLTTVHRLWLNDAADLILLPTDETRQEAIDLGVAPENLQVTGIPANPALAHLEGECLALRQKLGWQPDLPVALVVGSKRVKNLEDVLHVINHSGFPLQLAIVAGGDDDLYACLQETEWHGVAYLYNFVDNMPELMQAADLIVCKAGGLIVTESLACGLPLLLVDVTPGQEEGNANYVVKNGAGELAAEPLMVLETLAHWLTNDQQLLQQRAENARRVGRPRAAYTVADFIWSAAERGPLPIPETRKSLLPKLKDLLAQFGIRGDKTREDQLPLS